MRVLGGKAVKKYFEQVTNFWENNANFKFLVCKCKTGTIFSLNIPDLVPHNNSKLRLQVPPFQFPKNLREL